MRRRTQRVKREHLGEEAFDSLQHGQPGLVAIQQHPRSPRVLEPVDDTEPGEGAPPGPAPSMLRIAVCVAGHPQVERRVALIAPLGEHGRAAPAVQRGSDGVLDAVGQPAELGVARAPVLEHNRINGARIPREAVREPRQARPVVHRDDVPVRCERFDPAGTPHRPQVRHAVVPPVAVRVELVLVHQRPEPHAVVGVVAGDEIAYPEIFPLRHKGIAPAEGELKAPPLHDHFEPQAQFLTPAHYAVHGTKVVEVEAVKKWRLLAAAPGPGAARLPVAPAARWMERAHRHAHAQQVEALPRAAPQEPVHVPTAVGHAEQVVRGVPEDKDGFAGRRMEPPGPPRRGHQCAPGRPRRDEEGRLGEGLLRWRRQNGGGMPGALLAGAEAYPPRSLPIVEGWHGDAPPGGRPEDDVGKDVHEGVVPRATRRERPLAYGAHRDAARTLHAAPPPDDRSRLRSILAVAPRRGKAHAARNCC